LRRDTTPRQAIEILDPLREITETAAVFPCIRTAERRSPKARSTQLYAVSDTARTRLHRMVPRDCIYAAE